MRFLFIVLLSVVVATTVLAKDDAVAEPTGSKRATPDFLILAATQYKFPGARLLRIDKTTDAEERVLPIPVPSVALFTSWVKSLGSKITDSVQARYWLWRKQSADDLFKGLKLDGGVNKILANPKFSTWATYIDLFNKKNPNNKVSMAGVLTKTYGDLALARMLEVALNVRTQSKMAARLTRQQRQDWQAAGKSADDIFTLLKLDKAGNDIFVSPQLNTWYNYVIMIKKENAEAVMASVLTAHYGDAALAKIFLEANPRVRRMRFIRIRLETAVELYGQKKALSPDEFFKVLKLDEGVDKLLTNPNLVTWITFLGQFNAKKPGKETTMIKTFTKFYGDEALSKMLEAAKQVPKTEKVAKQLQAAQFKQWLRDGVKPSVIWKMLKMEKATWMTNPNAEIWRGYNALYKLHKNSRG